MKPLNYLALICAILCYSAFSCCLSFSTVAASAVPTSSPPPFSHTISHSSKRATLYRKGGDFHDVSKGPRNLLGPELANVMIYMAADGTDSPTCGSSITTACLTLVQCATRLAA